MRGTGDRRSVHHQQEKPQGSGRQQETDRSLGQHRQAEQNSDPRINRPRRWQKCQRTDWNCPRLAQCLAGFADPCSLGKEGHGQRGDEHQGRVDRGRPGRDREDNIRSGHQAGPKTDFGREQPPRQVIGCQGSADRQDRRGQACGKLALAQELETAHHQPEHQRRLVVKNARIESWHDPVATDAHFPGDRAVEGLVEVPQAGHPEIDETDHSGGQHDDELMPKALRFGTTFDKRYGQD